MIAEKLRPLAVSLGEPAGIGPDVILLAYANRKEESLPPFLVFGQAEFLKSRAKTLGLDIAIHAAPPQNAANVFETALPVVGSEIAITDQPGILNSDTGPLVIGAIRDAVKAVQNGDCRAIVTAPIHKAALYASGFEYPGHTEFLADLCATNGTPPRPVMMLAHQDLRVVPLTIHVPLADVPELVTAELIEETAEIVHQDLISKFGIRKPKLAFTGLNPHAGEDGSIGHEEQTIITPAIENLRRQGIDVEGPLSADTLFHPPHWHRFDAVIAMYHDQALIPIKTLAFDSGVNITLGLPIVRTSPDHGTALPIAGTGKASAKSMIAAIKLADAMTADKQ
jgi:4-hydroxythreonine-4-phosphate dehydrogenase